MAGRSVGSRATRRTGAMSRAGSRKSKVDIDFEEMELEEIEALIEEKVRLKEQKEKDKNRLERNEKRQRSTQKAIDQKLQPFIDEINALKD